MKKLKPRKNDVVFMCTENVNVMNPKEKVWVFWCPFCRGYHTHGAVRGYRESHCRSPELLGRPSPLYEETYFLEKETRIPA